MKLLSSLSLFWSPTRACLGLLSSSLLLVSSNPARGDSSEALALLEQHCLRCHGGAETKGGLDLLTRTTLLQGGESGQTIAPGDPEDSLLLQTVRHQSEPHMPYKATKLSDRDIAVLTDWVRAGTPYSRPLTMPLTIRVTEGEFTLTDADRRHWAFQPVGVTAPPRIPGDDQSPDNPIDAFILAKLVDASLKFAPRASRTVLIRRLTFDLIGLPPTPPEIDDFLNESSPDADERLLDRLLASPQYGERWGRHWLDLARFAETDGFEHDAVRPHSWRYRDYVIKSFNDNKPYDRFAREQLAGDELWPDDPEALTATGFNLLGPDMVDSSDQVQRRHNSLNDMTDTVSLTFLGLTLGCARCHDHKFEPIAQRDYYRLQAFFTSARFDREHPVPTPAIQAVYDAAVREFNEHPKHHELAAMESPVREQLFEEKLLRQSSEAQAAYRTPVEQRTAEQTNLLLETVDKIKVTDKELVAAFTPEQKQQHARLKEEVNRLPKPTPLPRAMTLAVDGLLAKTFILRRGEYSQPTDEVWPGFPAVMDAQPPIVSSDRITRRRQLADWIASPANPLTARVFVNRIWQHHFGRGLASSPSDFGTHGQRPTHPELLDWLAHHFVAHGWDTKQMHRQMLASTTYRQIAVAAVREFAPVVNDPSVLATRDVDQHIVPWKRTLKSDPSNRLFGRMSRLRLEGEAIRDSLLAISDRLNPAMTGPGVFPPIPKELFAGAQGWSTNERLSDQTRRSIYIFSRRNLRFPFLEVFDAPDSNFSCPVREGSTTAPQSLTLLNADEVMLAAKAMGSRLRNEFATTDRQIEAAYRLALGRRPTTKEFALAQQFLAQSPLEEFCRALFNLNDFVYVE